MQNNIKFINFLDHINIYLGIKVFNNLNLFTYNLFNFFYKLLIVKEKPDYIKNWINHGFQNFEKIPDTYINNLNNNLSNQEGLIKRNLNTIKENGFFEFQITTEIKNNILNIVKEPLKPLLGNLKTYYKSDIILSNMSVRRNYNTESNSEKYSNFFHNDAYVFTLIKIFINLQDVTSGHGPFQFIKQEDSKRVLKANNKNIIKNRLSHLSQENLINYNTGSKGEVFMCDTTKIIHSAGIPEGKKFRDILFLEFCAYPLKKDIEPITRGVIDEINFPNSVISKSISKPLGLRKTVKCLFKYF